MLGILSLSASVGLGYLLPVDRVLMGVEREKIPRILGKKSGASWQLPVAMKEVAKLIDHLRIVPIDSRGCKLEGIIERV